MLTKWELKLTVVKYHKYINTKTISLSQMIDKHFKRDGGPRTNKFQNNFLVSLLSDFLFISVYSSTTLSLTCPSRHIFTSLLSFQGLLKCKHLLNQSSLLGIITLIIAIIYYIKLVWTLLYRVDYSVKNLQILKYRGENQPNTDRYCI